MGFDDLLQFLVFLIVIGLFIFNIVKSIFGGKNEKLNDFLKSLDIEEEEEATLPERVKPLPQKKPPPPHKPFKPQKHASLTKLPPLEIKAPQVEEYKVDLTYYAIPVNLPSRGKKILSGNFREKIIVQTVLNKPLGAWW